MKSNPIDTQKFRKILAREFCKELDKIDTLDILQDFENCKEVQHRVNKMGGDISTNPEIARLEEDAEELIEMTVRNLKKEVGRMLPLYVLNRKEKKHDENN